MSFKSVRLTLLGLSALLYFVVSSCSSKVTSARVVENFNDGWMFSIQEEDAFDPAYQDTAWRMLSLPHDWSIEGSFNESNPSGVGGGALPGGVGWYRKKFNLTDEDVNRKIWIDFDGVYCNSEVWINNTSLGKRPNGYISFRYDLGPFIKAGENVIAVKVDNSSQPNSRWYSGSGIYRNVWLVKTDHVFVDHWGTQVTTPLVEASRAIVRVNTCIRNSSSTPQDVTLVSVIVDAEGKKISETTAVHEILADSVFTFDHELTVDKPIRWSVEMPALYKVISRVEYNGKTSDVYETNFGIRTFSFDSLGGFFLNEKPLKIKGVCLHHDLGALGAAINTRAIERQLQIMSRMGVNAIRTSHNPPAPELLDLCDRMGFIVMDEMFDMWKRKKSEFDYSTVWDEWHQRDLEDFIRRDRNHASVLIWSIGNEIGEQWDSTGTSIALELASIVRGLDSTRYITTGNNDATRNNYIIKSGALDLIGYNYNHKDYTSFLSRFPGEKFIATETTSALATRGHYDMPSDSIRRWPISWDKVFTQGNADNTVSAYDNVSTPWGSTHEETWKIVKANSSLSGMFIWTGFDYLGEPTPYTWPSRSSYFGVVDLAGFPKDTYYLYQSEWTSDTVLHVFPHWNWKEGDVVDVWAYYNHADEVELFLNDRSLGVRKKVGDELHVQWNIPFSPGKLRAVSRKGGIEVAERKMVTAGEPHQIIVESDRKSLRADGNDLAFITVKVLDKAGNTVPTANNTLRFSVEGAGTLIATDNGDPTSHVSFQSNEKKLFNGLALVIIKSSRSEGKIKVKVAGEGLESAELIITAE